LYYIDKKRVKKYHQSKKGKLMLEKAHKKHRQTEKGKITNRKAQRKCHAKRKRNFGWIQIFENPFDENVKIEWHHINDVYVVAIPKNLHHLYMGKLHREKTMEIVKQIYLE